MLMIIQICLAIGASLRGWRWIAALPCFSSIAAGILIGHTMLGSFSPAEAWTDDYFSSLQTAITLAIAGDIAVILVLLAMLVVGGPYSER